MLEHSVCTGSPAGSTCTQLPRALGHLGQIKWCGPWGRSKAARTAPFDLPQAAASIVLSNGRSLKSAAARAIRESQPYIFPLPPAPCTLPSACGFYIGRQSPTIFARAGMGVRMARLHRVEDVYRRECAVILDLVTLKFTW